MKQNLCLISFVTLLVLNCHFVGATQSNKSKIRVTKLSPTNLLKLEKQGFKDCVLSEDLNTGKYKYAAFLFLSDRDASGGEPSLLDNAENPVSAEFLTARLNKLKGYSYYDSFCQWPFILTQ